MNFFEMNDHDSTAVDRTTLRKVEPSQRAANVLQQTSSRYPELDQAAQLENYQQELQSIKLSESIQPIQLKSKRTLNDTRLKERNAGKAQPFQPISLDIFSHKREIRNEQSQLSSRFMSAEIKIGPTATKRATNLASLHDNQDLNKLFQQPIIARKDGQ